ncbi:MAG: RluA family pseudouridine synthase [Erysipelotrichaceae bacterium]|nr:RluA family pseudouridine synthase [Erysipelotrichaceae bacterium]
MYQINEPTTLLVYLVDHCHKKRNDAKNLLKYKQVNVNGDTITRYDYELKPGDILTIGEKQKNPLPFPILFENEDIIVIDKPCGLVAEQTRSNKDRTAYAIVKDYLKKKGDDIYLVHRLDQYTSGVMMFVKNKKLYYELTHNWNDYVVTRGYKAIVEGKLSSDKGTIDNYLEENKGQKVYVGSPKRGKRAITHYQVEKVKGHYSLLDVHLDTGRKNQIRVHMAHIHHPIIGDQKYGGTTNPIKRLGLHAYEFAFRHPFTKQVMSFKSDMPFEMKRLMGIKR